MEDVRLKIGLETFQIFNLKSEISSALSPIMNVMLLNMNVQIGECGKRAPRIDAARSAVVRVVARPSCAALGATRSHSAERTEPGEPGEDDATA